MTENVENQPTETNNPKDAVLTKAAIRNFRHKKTWFIKKFDKGDERVFANGVLRQYLKLFNPVRLSQFEIIKEIVYGEVLKFRIQGRMDRDDDWVYCQSSVNAYHKLQKRIEELRRKLGLVEPK